MNGGTPRHLPSAAVHSAGSQLPLEGTERYQMAQMVKIKIVYRDFVFEAPSSDDVDELGRYRGSQITSHTSIIGHGRRERGGGGAGGRWEQHGAPLETFQD